MEIEEERSKSNFVNSQSVIAGQSAILTTVSFDDTAHKSDGFSQQQLRVSAANGHYQPRIVAKLGYSRTNTYTAECVSPTKMSTSGRNNRRKSLPPLPVSPSLLSTVPKTTAGEDWNYQHHKSNRRMRRHQKKIGKKLRRLVQMAPNNNNEFLMQEHDHLYHLDDNETNSDEHNGDGEQGQRRLQTHRCSTSPEEDEEDYLARNFSNTYDVVHAERLFNMSKTDLIQEYQLMEERVQVLETKLRTALLEKRLLGDDDTEMTPKSESIPIPTSGYFTNIGHRYDSGIIESVSDSEVSFGSSSSASNCTPASSLLSSRRNSEHNCNDDDISEHDDI